MQSPSTPRSAPPMAMASQRRSRAAAASLALGLAALAHGADAQNFTDAQLAVIMKMINGSTIAQFEAAAAATASSNDSMDRAWLVLGGALVFLMHSGFALLEVGSVAQHNEKSILFKNAISPTFAALLFWCIGYPLAFGTDVKGGFMGGKTGWFLATEELFEPSTPGGMPYASATYATWFFQWAFAATASTIVSGAVAERIHYSLYMFITFFLTGFIYPIVVHWQWGGGWSAEWGVYDFAGSGVVHMVGGIAALVSAKWVGPRHGRFVTQIWVPTPGTADEDSGDWYVLGNELPTNNVKNYFKMMNKRSSKLVLDLYKDTGCTRDSLGPEVGQALMLAERTREWSNDMPAQSPVFQTIGVFILWFGWYGFNCASTLGISGDFGGQAAKVAVITTLGAASGAMSSMLATHAIEGSYDLGAMANGILAGLVGITGPCAMIEPWAAVVIGLVAGVIFVLADLLLQKLKIDDVVLAVPVHLFCGMWGVLAVGIFSSPLNFQAAFGADTCGILYGCSNGAAQLGKQAAFILIVFGWVAATTTIVLLLARVLGVPIKYTPEEQLTGTDDHYDKSRSPKNIEKQNMSPRMRAIRDDGVQMTSASA